jgi:hypothetical protein
MRLFVKFCVSEESFFIQSYSKCKVYWFQYGLLSTNKIYAEEMSVNEILQINDVTIEMTFLSKLFWDFGVLLYETAQINKQVTKLWRSLKHPS